MPSGGVHPIAIHPSQTLMGAARWVGPELPPSANRRHWPPALKRTAIRRLGFDRCRPLADVVALSADNGLQALNLGEKLRNVLAGICDEVVVLLGRAVQLNVLSRGLYEVGAWEAFTSFNASTPGTWSARVASRSNLSHFDVGQVRLGRHARSMPPNCPLATPSGRIGFRFRRQPGNKPSEVRLRARQQMLRVPDSILGLGQAPD